MPIGGKYKCDTQNGGGLDDCFTGNFLFAKSSPSGEPYSVYMLAPINLLQPGIYDAEFYVSMFCDQPECSKAEDFVSFGVAYSDSTSEADQVRLIQDESVYEYIRLENLGGQRKWIKKSVTFQVQEKLNSKPSVSNNSESFVSFSVEVSRFNVFIAAGHSNGTKKPLFKNRIYSI